jgi:hypothetical protein
MGQHCGKIIFFLLPKPIYGLSSERLSERSKTVVSERLSGNATVPRALSQ